MTEKNTSWKEKWKKERQLGRGGQGSTWLVSLIDDPTVKGVLKTLHRDNNAQSRGRMHLEATSLDVLSKQSAKVPFVLDGNTDRHSDKDVPLYFVMSYIDGNTLSDEVRERGPISLVQAVAITLDLAATVATGHRSNIVHRDLKPDNIIVRQFEPTDLVIVDFGLSFNVDESGTDNPLTNEGEQFRNRFLALPETNTPGSNRRDPRSDVTALSAILYYCITGHNPGHLRDANDKPPHRRPGFSVREALGQDPRVRGVELLLDRGFSIDLDNRYQTCQEFIDRVKQVIQLSAAETIDLAALASEMAQSLQKQDRKTQLVSYQPAAEKVRTRLAKEMKTIKAKLQSAFQVSSSSTSIPTNSIPAGCDLLTDSFVVTLTPLHHKVSRSIIFAFAAKGSQCVVLHFTSQALPNTLRAGTTWQEVVWFDPLDTASVDELIPFLEMRIADAMRELYDEVIAGGAAQA